MTGATGGETDRSPSDPPLVSVVIATRNRGEGLETGIESVLGGLAGVDAEVLYVDDGSTDETAAVLARHAAAGRIRAMSVDCAAPGRARNAGAARARGRYLLFTDDDCEIPPNWAADLLALRERHGVAVLSGGFEPARMETAAERYIEYRMQTVFGSRAKSVQAAPMMCLLVERAAFEEVGGFSDLRLSSMEDWEFCYRLTAAGHSLYYDPSVRVRHEYGRDWCYVRRRVLEGAWLGPTVWRLSGFPVAPKLARDVARFLTAPLWCLRYFPPGLYLPAVALEGVYFATRLAGVLAAPIVERRLRAEHGRSGA